MIDNRNEFVQLDMLIFGNDIIPRYPGSRFTMSTKDEAIRVAEAETFLRLKMRSKTSLWFDIPRIKNRVFQKQRQTPLSKGDVKRVTRELAEAQTHPGYSVHLVGDDITHWTVSFAGPSDTPYEGGNFRMCMFLDEDFPENAPRCRFYLPVVPHCNLGT